MNKYEASTQPNKQRLASCQVGGKGEEPRTPREGGEALRGTFLSVQRAPRTHQRGAAVQVDRVHPQGQPTNIFCLSGRNMTPKIYLPQTLSSREILLASLLS